MHTTELVVDGDHAVINLPPEGPARERSLRHLRAVVLAINDRPPALYTGPAPERTNPSDLPKYSG